MRSLSDTTRQTVDITIALIAGTALLPVVIVTALAIALLMGRPVFFRQARIGKNERPFELFKFRTMRIDRENVGLSSDAARLTAFGRLLRNCSLDEIPQLWNVLKGEMSLVGPRPLLPQYIERYNAFQRRRHEVRPGITGWAQVNGRNAITWEDKFRLDVWYVDNQSAWLDCRILFRTIVEVLFRRGVSAQGHVSVPEFQGSVNQE